MIKLGMVMNWLFMVNHG